MTTQQEVLLDSPLHKHTAYPTQYDATLLFAIARQLKRAEIGIHGELPFYGCDVWRAYEISWLNACGKPQAAMATFIFAADAPYLIESKSFKLYLNSLNNAKFANTEAVKDILMQDLSVASGKDVIVELTLLSQLKSVMLENYPGILVDEIDCEINTYLPNADFLKTSAEVVNETLYSNLLKSNCPITNQPDWGSVRIQYRGRQIDREGLLKYIVSFRNHNEFHEQCVERIYLDVMQHCQPEFLSVDACYTRRGGLDISPLRASEVVDASKVLRQIRQ